MRWIALLVTFMWAGGAVAQGKFSATWQTVCTLGQDTNAGCDDIRAREILDAADPQWRAIGRVNFASRSQRSHCTGVLVADDLVLTAAHCLYNSARKRWIPPTSIKFAAGYQRGQAVAVSQVIGYRMDPLQGRDARFNSLTVLDWAVLELAEPLGQQLGFFEISKEAAPDGFVAGYPGLRRHVLSRTGNCAPRPAGSDLFSAICPVMMGDSGAPLLVETETGLKVAAILSRIAPTPQGIDALFLRTSVFGVQVP